MEKKQQKRLNNALRNIRNAMLLLVCGIFTGYVFLILAYLLPTDRMQSNVSASAEIFDKEREYHRVIPGYVSTQLDNYTDSWMVGNAVYGDSTDPVWKQALTCTRAEYGEGPLDGLLRYLSGEDGFREEDYTRYWHGYLIVLKPFFLFFDYADLRFVNVVLELMLVICVFSQLFGRGYRKEAWGYVVSVLFIMPIVIPLSIQFSIIFYVTHIAAIVLLKRYHQIMDRKRMLLFFQLIGMTASFFDFLTYPAASLGVPLVCLMVLERDRELWDKIKQIVCLSISWGFGYGAMWAGKWVLSTVILQDNVILDALSQIAMRSSHVQEGEQITMLDTWLRNVEFYFEKPYLILIAVCVILAAAGIVRNRKQLKHVLTDIIPLLIVAAIPFAWYAFAGQHSYEHHWFTYRALMTSVFACMCICAQLFPDTEKQIGEHENGGHS